MDRQKQQSSSIKDLIAKGKEQGFLTYAEVNDHLPDSIVDPEQIEDIVRMINDMGIQVHETAPDADTLILSTDSAGADDVAAEEAAAALAGADLDVVLKAMGKSIGPPWQARHKLAATAALATLQSA